MKSEELMIGDWVLYKKPMKVVEIRDFTYLLNITLHKGTMCNESDLDPIPVTEAILAENGFEHIDPRFQDSYDEYWLLETPEYVITVKEQTRPGFFNVRIKNSSLEEVKVCINFVHELQQAIRVCKVNKTIEL